jgi:hypothetical protein
MRVGVWESTDKPPARGLAARRHVGEAMTCAMHPEYRSDAFGFAV